MIDIRDLLLDDTNCPCCGADNKGGDIDFFGKHVLLVVKCSICKETYIHTVSVSHASVFPISFSVRNNCSRYEKKSEVWHATPLINAYKRDLSVKADIHKEVRKKYKDVILLNCLDDCYGHVLWRLLNAYRHLTKHTSSGLIILIPKSFQWLIPEGVAEVWTVDVNLKTLNHRVYGLDDWIKKEVKRFEKIHLSKAYIHLDHHKIDLKAFIKTTAFPLSSFEEKPFRVIFILREDRFWLKNKFHSFVFKLSRKYDFTRRINLIFIRSEERMINHVIKRLRKDIRVETYALGIGHPSKNLNVDIDYRSRKINDEIERNWCDLYKEAHLVVGVHGSNMMIPTALSAGFVEIVPEDKIDHITEDLLFRQGNRFQLFLGRHLPQHVSPQVVSAHINAMLTGFPFLFKNTTED